MDRNTGDKEGTPWVLLCRWEDPPDLCASFQQEKLHVERTTLGQRKTKPQIVGSDDAFVQGIVKGIIIFVCLD